MNRDWSLTRMFTFRECLVNIRSWPFILWCILNKLQLNRFCKVYNLIVIENNWLESRHVSRHMLRLTWTIFDCSMLHFRFFKSDLKIICLLYLYFFSVKFCAPLFTPVFLLLYAVEIYNDLTPATTVQKPREGIKFTIKSLRD